MAKLSTHNRNIIGSNPIRLIFYLIMYIIEFIMLFLATIAPVLLSIAFFTLAERKIIATIQRRKGPNVVFFWGLLQPIADGLKAILKELVFPKRIDFFLFLVGPLLTFLLSVVGWFLIPLSLNVTMFDYNLSFVFFFVIAGLGFYGVLLASWASNSKYAMLAAFRSVAQLISYEIFIALNILPIIAFTGSWNFIDIAVGQSHIWNVFLCLPLAIIFFVALLAETNRIPFDLPEAEAEIVAGYNIEYSGFIFALFFLGEYSNMILNAIVIVILFFGAWGVGNFSFFNYLSDSISIPFLPTVQAFFSKIYIPFSFIFKILIFNFLWIDVRATLPRYRYDQLMDLGWKVFLPITLSIFYLYICLGIFFNSFPFALQVPSF